jgi:DNA (cytosine-5)-methyltransferase 1
MTYRLGSLFSGIGGLELGFERTGQFKTVFQVEKDPFCRAVLAKHWRSVPRFEDICNVTATSLPKCHILVGGFPCQDVSIAGRGAGLDGSRSGLWREFARLIGSLRPRVVLVENVAGLISNGLAEVIGDLSKLGYDAEWSLVSACAFGSPHTRARLFIVAYPNGKHGSRGLGIQPRLKESVFVAGDHDPSAFPWEKTASANPRGVNGLSRGLDYANRARALGNSIVPQVAQFVAQRILEAGLLNSRAA